MNFTNFFQFLPNVFSTFLFRPSGSVKDKIIADAKLSANQEAENIITSAREAIQHEKMAAINARLLSRSSAFGGEESALTPAISQQLVPPPKPSSVAASLALAKETRLDHGGTPPCCVARLPGGSLHR